MAAAAGESQLVRCAIRMLSGATVGDHVTVRQLPMGAVPP